VSKVSKFVLLGVGGGIAAYKSASICSYLLKQGYEVQVLMTENATQFIQPLTFQSLTKKPVIIDTFKEPNPAEIAHIATADRADLFLVAPATANLIGKLANGIADDMVTTTALATTAQLVIAPAMNVHMLEHPAVQENIQRLKQRGVIVIEPGSGPLACGYTGKGRLAEPEDVVEIVNALLMKDKQDLCGLRVLVTAGPTIEDIDPVRFLSNASSGKMGYELAAAAAARGASVELVSGPTNLSPPMGVDVCVIRSTEEMLRAVQERVRSVDVLISAAAPVDFRPVERMEHKWKKSSGMPVLQLEPTPDILTTVGALKTTEQTFVGFAAETRNAIEYGRSKLQRKHLDLIVINDLTEPGAGFGVDTNKVTMISRGGEEESLPLLDKRTVAQRILDKVALIRRSPDAER
jgi:phosphopantothenoylcysteine decarboxylase/phosphopantothenate--cysteine ligase